MTVKTIAATNRSRVLTVVDQAFVLDQHFDEQPGRDAKGQHVRERVELSAECAPAADHARDLAVERVEHHPGEDQPARGLQVGIELLGVGRVERVDAFADGEQPAERVRERDQVREDVDFAHRWSDRGGRTTSVSRATRGGEAEDRAGKRIQPVPYLLDEG